MGEASEPIVPAGDFKFVFYGKQSSRIGESIIKKLKGRYNRSDISPSERQQMVKNITNDVMKELEPELKADPTGKSMEVIKADVYREVSKLADAREAQLIVHPKIPIVLQALLFIGVPTVIFGIFLSLAYIIPGTIPPGNVIFPHLDLGGPIPIIDPIMVQNQGLVNGALYGGIAEGIALLAWKIIR